MAEGRGVAFARYENDQAIVACIAEVQVEKLTGAVRVKRIVLAHDCGLIINPDGVKNQIEGSVIQSLSRALKEEVQFDELRITSVDWQTYTHHYSFTVTLFLFRGNADLRGVVQP